MNRDPQNARLAEMQSEIQVINFYLANKSGLQTARSDKLVVAPLRSIFIVDEHFSRTLFSGQPRGNGN